MTVVVIGAGASGMFAAISAARRGATVFCLESSAKPLKKVLLSGGGRCNVMHQALPLKSLASNYPRGHRELLGPLSEKGFSQLETRAWFEAEGVELKVEEDGRMFPVTDDSETIASALRRAAKTAGVRLEVGVDVLTVEHQSVGADTKSSDGNEAVEAVENETGSFRLHLSRKRQKYREDAVPCEDFIECGSVVVATGSAPRGYSIAQHFGHTTHGPYPSLFSFRTLNKKDASPSCLLHGLAGVTLSDVALGLVLEDESAASFSSNSAPPKGQKSRAPQSSLRLEQRGSLLVTHRGVSGPCALRLSAFAAEHLQRCAYKGTLTVNLLPTITNPGDSEGVNSRQGGNGKGDSYFRGGGIEAVLKLLQGHRRLHAGTPVVVSEGRARRVNRPFQLLIPRRLWNVIAASSIPAAEISSQEAPPREAALWSGVSNAELRVLARRLCALELPFSGKDTNKEEFVTGGGVALSEINLKKMESKLAPGLFFCGEVMDVDGVTGGFNFQACWTSGFLAGTAAAESATAK